ncbi:MAG: Ig-like domain-containing protein [Pseudomonadota bacterium]
MSPFPRSLKPGLRVLMLLIAVVNAGCLNEGDPGTSPSAQVPTPVAKVAQARFTTGDVLMPVIGATQALAFDVRDANDDAIAVAVNWTSSNPAAVSVDTLGNVTALAIGTAVISASIGGGDTVSGMPLQVSVNVSAVAVRATTRTASADELLAPIEIMSTTANAGYVATVVLPDFGQAFAVGEGLIMTDYSVVGTIESAALADGQWTLSVASADIGSLLLDAELLFSASQDTVEFLTAAPTPVGKLDAPAQNLPDSALFSSRAALQSTTISGLLEDILPGFVTSIDQSFKCSTDTGADATAINPQLSPSIDINDVDLSLRRIIRNGGTEEVSIAIDTDFDVTFDGYIEWTPTLTASITCKRILRVPFRQLGPVVIMLPLGIGFTLELQGQGVGGRVSVQGTMPASVSFTGSAILDAAGEVTLDAPLDIQLNTDDVDVSVTVPDSPSDALSAKVDAKVFGFALPRVGLGVGANFGLYSLLDHWRLGLSASLDVANETRQVRDETFKADAMLSVYGKREVPETNPLFRQVPFVNILWVTDALGLYSAADLAELMSFEVDTVVSESPTGVTQRSILEPVLGDTIEFALTLSPENFLGAYQIDEVVVYRVIGEGLSASLVEFTRIVATDGQTLFEWNWQPTEQETGIAKWAIFATSRAFGGLVFQVDDVFEVNVIDDSAAPPVETRIRTRASVGVRGRVTLTGTRLEDLEESDSSIQDNSAVATLSTSGVNAVASASGNTLIVDVGFNGRLCGEFDISASAAAVLDRRNLPPGTVVAGSGSLSGPAVIDLNGYDETRGLLMIVNVSGEVANEIRLEGSETSANGTFIFQPANPDAHLTWDTERSYQGGSAQLVPEALMVPPGGPESGDVEADLGIGIFLDIPCGRDRPPLQLQVSYQLTFSS